MDSLPAFVDEGLSETYIAKLDGNVTNSSSTDDGTVSSYYFHQPYNIFNFSYLTAVQLVY
jgi:hypothetical protein